MPPAIMTAENGGRDGNVSTCRSHVDETVLTALQGTTIALALLILIILGFTFKRKRLLQRFFWGLPGIVVPVNLLTYSPSRLVLVLIFGVMSGDILRFIIYGKDFIIYSNVNCYSKSFLYSVLTPLLLISYLSLKFFPLFACVGVTVPILGPSLGLLYSIILFSYNAYHDFSTICVLNTSDLLGVALASRVHIYGASLIIVLWFLWDLVKSFVLVCRKGFRAAMLMKCKTASGYYYYTNYVRHLLRRKPGVYRNYTVCKVLACVMPFWFSPRKLPLKFVAAMTITFSMIYQFSLVFFGLFLILQLELISLLKSKKQQIIEFIASNPNLQLNGKSVYETLLDIAQGLGVVLPVSPIIAMVFCFVLLFHLIITVYKNIADSARGKFKFVSLQPTLQLSYSWRYPGYQIAFAFTALVFYTFVLWMLGIFGLGIYFAFKHFLSQSLCALTVIIFPVAWLIIALLIQVILAKVAFIKERAGKFIVLNNIRVFHWVSYFLFIYEAIGGLFAAILRTLFSLLFILVLMLRLDKVVFMKGFQWFDIGHKAYMGFLHLNHTYNNPVVHAFILLLSESSTHHHSFYSTPKPTSKLLDYQDSDAFGEGKFAVTGGKKYGLTANGGSVQMGVIRTRSIQIRNRWLVAYTLIRNPSLQRPPAPADHTPMPLPAPRPTTSELKWQGQTQE